MKTSESFGKLVEVTTRSEMEEIAKASSMACGKRTIKTIGWGLLATVVMYKFITSVALAGVETAHSMDHELRLKSWPKDEDED